MKLSEVSIRRPVFATMIMGALVVMGLFSLQKLSVEMFPKVDFPYTTVVTIFKGASAETVETQVSKKIEDKVNEISGVRNIYSTSREGYSLVIVEFRLEKNSFEGTNEVREKVAGIRGDLPTDIDEPIISTFDPTSQPILSLAISGQRTPKEMTELAKNKIKKRLETIPGIGAVTLIGGSEREILIALNPEKMEAQSITVADVEKAVTAANLEIPGGRVDESSREYLVRTMGRVTDVAQFNSVVVKNHHGVPVYLKDVAAVLDTTVEQRSLSRYNGHTTVALGISKQSGANTVDVATRARDLIAQLQGEVPPDVNLKLVEDDSRFITDSIHEINFNIRFGMLLAVIVIFLFLLDIRPTLIAGLSIPISLVATFTIMNALGFTINMITLMGLSLAVGILIDDAIVVIENIYRHIHMGETARNAAFTATKEIGLAVMATTFSIVVVFLPVAFMEGIIGRFFYQFGVSVAVAVSISLFVAFTLTPMLSSRWLEQNGADRLKAGGWGAAFERFWQPIRNVLNYWNRAFEWFKPKYESLLASSLRHRWLVMVIATASFAFAIFMIRFVGSEFMTETDEGKIYVSVVTPPGTDLQETSRQVARIEEIVTKIPIVTSSYVTIGAGDNPVTDARILFTLVDKSQRSVTAKQMMDSVRVLLAGVPGVKIAVDKGQGEGGGSKGIEISVRGEDLGQLSQIAHQVQGIFYSVPGAVDIDNTQQEGKPELHIEIDRKQADDLGLSLVTIPMTIRTLVEGQVVSRYKEGDEEYDVRVRLDDRFRSSTDEVGRLLVASTKEIPGQSAFLVPLDRVAKIDKRTAIGQYNRRNRQREIRVNANVVSGAFSGTVSNLIMQEASKIQLPPGYSIGVTGGVEFMNESFQNIFRALILSVIFIYLLLASQYESFTDPFSIMLSLPLSLVGAILALQGSSFSIMSLIGIILLMGLVTKNAILLIDFVKQQRETGMSRTEAILKAGPIRLRPILMTTFAMVFGMLPLALGVGPGAEMRAPMARAVIGGIISSTLLTLVVVPVVYTIIEDFTGLFRRRRAVTEPVREKGLGLAEQVDSPH
jgi:hydrophobe/amphiphile efflux-1 (HAE1) family protein